MGIPRGDSMREKRVEINSGNGYITLEITGEKEFHFDERF